MSSWDWKAWEEKHSRAIIPYRRFSYFDPSPENWVREYAIMIWEERKLTDEQRERRRDNIRLFADIFSFLSSLLDDKNLRRII